MFYCNEVTIVKVDSCESIGMAQEKKKYKLELSTVLAELDRGNKNFYNTLTPEEKKAYVPLILMRYMSSLGDQSRNKEYAIIATNDLVNIGFWQLSKYPDLQHLLLCVASLGSKQYHQWIPNKSKVSKTPAIDQFFIDLYPDINEQELAILKQTHDKDSFKQLLYDAGKSEAEIKTLMEEWKKHSKNG